MTPAACLPLVTDPLDAPFAVLRDRVVSRRGFVSDVLALARSLPDRGHVLNVCGDRYRFAVGLGAAIVRGQVTVLPASTQVAVLRPIVVECPDLYCLADGPQAAIDLPQTIVDESTIGACDTTATDLPAIPVDHVVAHVFTSGSTGTPTRHRKRWGSVVRSAIAEAHALFGSDASRSPFAIVATVPAQHMYGLESSVLIAWHGPALMTPGRPFFPADVVDALEAVDASTARRMLVTTPFHLKTMLAEVTSLPRVDLVLSATAPLSLALAHETERRFGAPIAEIYGCTETGQLATRRPTEDAHWTLFDGVELDVDGDVACASGGHVEQRTTLADRIALAADYDATKRFSLVGRSGDLVNIAGKRTSLAHLDAQLVAIDGVVDGAFFQPDDDAAFRDGVSRLGAVVVAPTLTPQRLLDALRARIDPAFMPRPLHFVDGLPRTPTGKVTDAVLRSIASGAVPARSPEPALANRLAR